MLMTLWLSLVLGLPATSLMAFKMPVLRAVPVQDRVLQMEAGTPARSKRRGRVELLLASLRQ